ncbi:type II secretion system protein GspL [Desulfosarcina sp.]|uniref:type II secretion system protein GspL n=1 Tax=Desulfosarcina sp. TaxID=2027861 RepID=UPI0039707729
MSRKVLGIEIREESVSAVLLDGGFKGSVLTAQVHFSLPADQPAEVGLQEALKAVVETLNPSGAACVLGIPDTAVSYRNLSIPFLDIKKVRQVLPFELEPTLPRPVDELVFDFEAVKRDGQHDLLAFAVQKAHIQRYLEILGSVNLRPVVIMPGGYAAARFICAMTADDDDFLFIDTGAGNHTVYAVCSGSVRMARTLPVASGGNPAARSLETAMQRTFTAMQDNLGIAVNPSTVFSSGPQSQLLDAGNGSSTFLGVPVKSIAGIRTFPRLTGSLDTPDWQSGRLDIALALALVETESVGGINFSTERSTVQHYWSEYRSHIILTAVLITLALTLALAGQFFAVRAKERRLAEMDRQIEAVFKSTFPEVTRVVNPLQQMQIKIKEAGEGSTGFNLTSARVQVIDILNALSQQIPSAVDVEFNRMVVGADNVVLSGDTDTFNTVDDIKGQLEGAEIFKLVTISSADLEKSGQRVRFKMKLDF